MKYIIFRFIFQLSLIVVYVAGYSTCPNHCSSHGRCNDNQQCECFNGYMGGDCSQRICPFGDAWADFASGTDLAHLPAECSNRGICDRTTGDCDCQTGFDGAACERRQCPSNCNQRGKCQSLMYHAQTKDRGQDMESYPGEEGEINKVYTYYSRWDSEKIFGCNCDEGFYGTDCSLQYCPTGDDPKTPDQFNEEQKGICTASAGTFTLSFRGETTKPIPYNAKAADLKSALEGLSTVTRVGVSLFGAAVCSPLEASFIVTFQQQFGDLPILVPDTKQLAFPDGNIEATMIMSEDRTGSKESDECSNRGICDATSGVCVCSTGFKTSDGYNQEGIRGDCGYNYQVVKRCPGPVSCSGHGMCNSATHRCSCMAGWRGAECSERTCPTGTAWFGFPTANEELHVREDVECSNAGSCDRTTGRCACLEGFSGASCNRLDCKEGCSGHGHCLNMYEMAKISEVNGVVAGFTYGDTPNNPVTWDAEMVMGCVCNKGFHGYDCSLYSCPTGDNPDSQLQTDEMQKINCTDADSTASIVLDYKGQLTAPLSTSTSSSSLRDALEALGNIRVVDVANITVGDSLCATEAEGGGGFEITFLTEHGDLPLLSVHSSTTGDPVIEVIEVVKGTKENAVCSDRGICDETTGTCECFAGYAGSNGMGGPGIIPDCGHVEKIVADAGG